MLIRYFALILALAFGTGTAQADIRGATFTHVRCAEIGIEPTPELKPIQCGWLDAPESWGASSNRRVKIAVAIAKATGTARADPIIYVHGGPGIAAVERLPIAMGKQSWPPLRINRDIIFFDQRGTGRSSPRLCTAYDDGWRELTRKALSQAAELNTKIALARACHKHLQLTGFNFSSHSAVTIAQDMEALRQLLGYERWNIFGTSYGSLPAMESMRRYPRSVRAVLLDSAFPPNSPHWAEQLTITAAALGAVQRQCDADPACRKRYPDIRGLASRAIIQLDSAPLGPPGDRVSGSKFADAMWTALVGTSTVRFIPELLSRAAARDDKTIRTFVAAFGDDSFGSYSPSQALIVNCHDVFAGGTAALVRRAIELNRDLAGDMVAEEQDRLCAEIGPARASANFFGPVESAIPTLIFAGEFDPATPPIDAFIAARFLKHATIVEVPGASHAPFYTDDCTRRIGADFFDDPEVPVETACLAARPLFRFASPAEFDTFIASLK